MAISKIGTNSIADGAVGSDDIASGAVTGAKLASDAVTADKLDVGQIGGRRNLIINGAMQVAQRGTQSTGITTTGFRTVDHFRTSLSSLGTWTEDQATDAPDGFANSFKLTCTTADASPAAGDVAYLRYMFEGNELQGLAYGTSSAKELTLSFWVKSNKTGSASVQLLQNDNSSKNISPSYTISSADTWEYKTITIPADTAGNIDNDTGPAVSLIWWLNSGSTYSSGTTRTTWTAYNAADSNPANLGVGGATSDYFAITGVQLEVGSVATPFEHRTFQDEWLACMRYFQKSYRYNHYNTTVTLDGAIGGFVMDGTNSFNHVTLQVPMRDAPNVTLYSRTGVSGKITGGSFSEATATVYQNSHTGFNVAGVSVTGADTYIMYYAEKEL